MSTVTMHRCDQCGKLAEGGDDIPKGWRTFRLPFFDVTPREACSPGCAKRLLGDNVDAEWVVEPAITSRAPGWDVIDVPVIDGVATLPDGTTVQSTSQVVRVPVLSA